MRKGCSLGFHAGGVRGSGVPTSPPCCPLVCSANVCGGDGGWCLLLILFVHQRDSAFGCVTTWGDQGKCQEGVPMLKHRWAWTRRRRGLVAGTPPARQDCFMSPLHLVHTRFFWYDPILHTYKSPPWSFIIPKRLLPSLSHEDGAMGPCWEWGRPGGHRFGSPQAPSAPPLCGT